MFLGARLARSIDRYEPEPLGDEIQAALLLGATEEEIQTAEWLLNLAAWLLSTLGKPRDRRNG